MILSLLSVCVVQWREESPIQRPLPPLQVIRDTLKKNNEGRPNRRIKHVVVCTAGEPKEQFPSTVLENREVSERAFAADGRWREKNALFRWGKIFENYDAAFDGVQTVLLEGKMIPVDSFTEQGLKVSVQVVYHAETQQGNSVRLKTIPFTPFSFWDGLHRRLGIRSSLTWAKGDKPLILLNPRVDDGSSCRETITLDPAKNYWPVASLAETRDKNGDWTTNSFTRVVEFRQASGRLFPKQLTIWHPGARNNDNRNLETWYITVLEAEFPDRFDDDVFRVTIPDGATVIDGTVGKRYVQGQVEVPEPPPSPAAESKIPLDLWFIYCGFFVQVMLVAAAARYFINRNRPEPRGRP